MLTYDYRLPVERLFEASSQDNIIRQIVQADEGEYARIRAWLEDQMKQQLPEKVSIRQHTSAYIRQHTSAYVSIHTRGSDETTAAREGEARGGGVLRQDVC
jgi:hypothetical protein